MADDRSSAAIAAQQALSNRYGIPTFDLSGKISTVPSSGIFSKLATTVGVGAYRDATPNSLVSTLQGLLSQVTNTGGRFANTVFPSPQPTSNGPQGAPTSNSTNVNPPSSSAPANGSQIQFNGDTLKKGWQTILSTIGPAGLLVGVVVVGVVLLRK